MGSEPLPSIYAGHPNGNLLELGNWDFEKLRIQGGPEIHTGERWKGENPAEAELKWVKRTPGGVVRASVFLKHHTPPTYLEQIDLGKESPDFGTPRYGKIKLRIPDERVNTTHGGQKSLYPRDIPRTGLEVVRIHEIDRVVMSNGSAPFRPVEI